MLKRDQVRGLAETFDRDGKAHVGEYPTDEEGGKSMMEKSAQQGFYELRITYSVMRNVYLNEFDPAIIQ
ncbi:MAG: hypothetical protein JETCAE01_33720 [Anaerolineaceae bacterium]|nr:MAG: hypothetical protein JETCAE01_33720 [Anaerolineaceae bacterium]